MINLDMYKLYKRLILLLLFICSLSAIVIYFTLDIGTVRQLGAFRPQAVMLALVFWSAGMYFDAIRLVRLVHISRERITLFQAMQVIFSNYFLALLTPGATGGAVAQVLFLRHAGLPIGKATVLVLVRTILSVFFLIVCLPLVSYIDPALVPGVSPSVIIVSTVALLAISIGGLYLVRTKLAKRLILLLVKRLALPTRLKLWKLYRDVRLSVNMLADNRIGMTKVFIETGLSLLALYSIVPALFMGLDIPVNWMVVLGRMIALNLLLYFAPTPGGAGVAEGGFILLFSNLVPPGTIGILAVAWRFLAEYFPFVIGVYFSTRAFGSKLIQKVQ